jgi:hypothetical protein
MLTRDRLEVLARLKGGAGVLRRRVPPFISFFSEAQRTLRFGHPKFFLKKFQLFSYPSEE